MEDSKHWGSLLVRYGPFPVLSLLRNPLNGLVFTMFQEYDLSFSSLFCFGFFLFACLLALFLFFISLALSLAAAWLSLTLNP